MNKKIIGILIGMLFLVPISTVVAVPDKPDGANRAPCAPIIIDEIRRDEKLECQCTFYSIDPDGDDIYYNIDWGDSNQEIIPLDKDRTWDGRYSSGEQLSLNHKYSERGEYEITIKARDIHKLESPSTIVPITISYFKAFNLILERIQSLFPILEDLFNL